MENQDLEQLANPAALSDWLDQNIPEMGSAPLQVSFLHGGTSNVILSLNRGEQELVLRRPPLAPPPGSSKTVQREATVLSALTGSEVPIPQVYGKCFDKDVIGDCFYVMERVDGWSPELNNRKCLFEPPFDAPPHNAGLAHAMIDGLVALAGVNYQAVGLTDFGKPDGFLQRQVERWKSQLESYPSRYNNYQGRDIPGLSFVADWLQDNIPDSTPPGILHGDYGFPNVLFKRNTPARLSAILDWELATIGDPMLDIGWYLNAFRDARDPTHAPHNAYFDALQFPTRQELAARYCEGSGRSIAHLDYYLVLALYKATCIIEYKVAAAADGLVPQDVGKMFEQMVLDSAMEAEKIARWN